MRSVSLALTVALAACSGPSGGGPSPSQSGFGYSERGRLASGDARFGEQYVDGYTVGVAADPVRPLAITLDSGSFDAVMVLIDPQGDARVVADCEGTADACVRIEAPSRGTWHVRVTSATPGASGGYTFAVASPLPGIVAPAPLSSRDAPLLPLRGTSTPEAPPARPAPDPTSGAPMPLPYDPGRAITAEQSLAGTLSGGDGRVRFEGRTYPSKVVPLRLRAYDNLYVKHVLFDAEPLVLIARDGEVLEVGRDESDGRVLGTAGARLYFSPPETGDYELHLTTTGAALVGEYEAEIWFDRNDHYVYGGPIYDGDGEVVLEGVPLLEATRAPAGATHTVGTAVQALVDAAPGFGAVRGERLGTLPSGEAVYASTVPLPASHYTNLICEAGRCSLLAVFPTVDYDNDEGLMSELDDALAAASGGALRKAVTSAGGVYSATYTSGVVRAELSLDTSRYDALLGAPVVLRIEGR